MEFLGWIFAIAIIFLSAGAALKIAIDRDKSEGLAHACFAAGGVMLWVALCIGGAGTISAARGRDLGQWGNSDPALRQWYQSLMQPDIPNASCCGEADAYFCDDYRLEGGKALCTISDDRPDEPFRRPHIDVGTVIEIPPHKLKWDRGNPTGHSVVFLSRGHWVFCFVQGGGV